MKREEEPMVKTTQVGTSISKTEVATNSGEVLAITASSSAESEVSKSFLGKVKDGIVGIYGLVLIAVTLIMHGDVGWLAAIGYGIIWPLTLCLKLFHVL